MDEMKRMTSNSSKVDRLIVLDGPMFTLCATAQGSKIRSMTALGGHLPVGSIVLASVETVNVEKGIAFVNIGESRPALLHLKDIPTNGSHVGQIKGGDTVILEVFRSRTDNKGARVTGTLEFKSEHMVFMPFDKGVHVSRKIDKKLQKTLKTHFEGLVERDGIIGGILLRSSSEHVDICTLENELAMNLETYARISRMSAYAKPPKTLYEPGWQEWVTECLQKDHAIERLVTNSPRIFSEMNLLARRLRQEGQVIEAVLESMPCFPDYSGLIDWLVQTAEKRHPLECGGELVIETTEAMTVVDVNAPVGKGSASAPQINKEAVVAVMEWLDVTKTSGITIVDLIACESQKERDTILAYAKDTARSFDGMNVHGVSRLGLLEITTQNTGEDLFRFTGGRDLSDPEWLVNLAAVSMASDARNGSEVTLSVSPSVLKTLESQRTSLERAFLSEKWCDRVNIRYEKKNMLKSDKDFTKEQERSWRKRTLWIVEEPEMESYSIVSGSCMDRQKNIMEITWESDNYIDA